MLQCPSALTRALRRGAAVGLLAALLLAACAAPPPASLAPDPAAVGPGDLSFPLRTPFLEFGAGAQLLGTDSARALTLAGSAGFDWVLQPVAWREIERAPGDYAWGPLDQIVEAVAAHDLRLLVRVGQAPAFYSPSGGLPRDPAALAAFAEAMARRYGNRVAAYQIWSRQNLAAEHGGQVTLDDIGRYVETLAACYRRIKAAAPDAYVLAGAPAPTGADDSASAISDLRYYQASYSYGGGMIGRFFDAQAVELDSAAHPPVALWPARPRAAPGGGDDPRRYFRHVEQVRQQMEAAGLGDRQIWITSLGWATRNSTPGYEFGSATSLAQQGDYLSAAIARAEQEYRDGDGRPWVGAVFVWNLNLAVVRGAEGQPDHAEASFSLLNPDWSPRPAFLALQELLARLKQAQGR